MALLPGPSLGLNQSPGRGPETQPGLHFLSTSTGGHKELLGCIRLPGLLLADALRRDLHGSLQGQPMHVCSSGPPHSPLLTHPSPLFHQQTLGLESLIGWQCPAPRSPPCLNTQPCLSCVPSHQDLTVAQIPAPSATHPCLSLTVPLPEQKSPMENSSDTP